MNKQVKKNEKNILLIVIGIMIFIGFLIINDVKEFKFKELNSKKEYFCKDGYLHYKDRNYERIIWVGNNFKIKCEDLKLIFD